MQFINNNKEGIIEIIIITTMMYKKSNQIHFRSFVLKTS